MYAVFIQSNNNAPVRYVGEFNEEKAFRLVRWYEARGYVAWAE